MDSVEIAYLRACECRERAAAKLARNRDERRQHREEAARIAGRIAHLERQAEVVREPAPQMTARPPL